MARRAHGEGTILKRKDGRWQGQLSIGFDSDGERNRKTVYGKTQKEVREKLDKVKQQLANGALSNTRLTLSAYLERWLTEKERQVKPRSVDFYREHVERYINPNLGSMKLEKILPMHIQMLISEVADNTGVSTANKCRTTLFTALKQALRWQLIPRNPVEAVDKLKEPPREMKLWAPGEAKQFLYTALPHRLYAAFYLAMSAGLRRGEVLGLRWQDVEEDKLIIRQSVIESRGRILFTTPKTSRGQRQVFVGPDVVRVLTDHQRRQDAERLHSILPWPDTDLVFTTQVGSVLHPRNFTRVWYTLQEKAEVTRVSFHALRHLNVSMRRKIGQDAKLIADQVGHADPAFTIRLYTHLFEDEREASAVDLDELLKDEELEDEAA